MRWDQPALINSSRHAVITRLVRESTLQSIQKEELLLAINDIFNSGTMSTRLKGDVQSKLRIEGVADQLKDSTFKQMANFITVGFELETQETNGLTQRNLGARVNEYNNNLPLDKARYKRAFRDRFKTLLGQGIRVDDLMSMPNSSGMSVLHDLIYTEWLKSLDPKTQAEAKATDDISRKAFYALLEEVGNREEFTRMANNSFPSGRIPLTAFAGKYQELLQPMKKAVYERTKQEIRVEDYKVQPLDTIQYIQQRLLRCTPEERVLFSPGTDGSVQGFEIRTNGALSIAQFIRASSVAFKKNKHVIDDRCSFHIHVGIKNLRHQNYDPVMQSRMYEYLAEHIGEVPESVRQRWRNTEQINRFAKFELQHEKYTFVNCHRLGTWEFRCFGNVTNHKDAVKCMALAVRALAYAYECASGNKQSILGDKLVTPTQMTRCVTDTKPLSTFVTRPKPVYKVKAKVKGGTKKPAKKRVNE